MRRISLYLVLVVSVTICVNTLKADSEQKQSRKEDLAEISLGELVFQYLACPLDSKFADKPETFDPMFTKLVRHALEQSKTTTTHPMMVEIPTAMCHAKDNNEKKDDAKYASYLKWLAICIIAYQFSKLAGTLADMVNGDNNKDVSFRFEAPGGFKIDLTARPVPECERLPRQSVVRRMSTFFFGDSEVASRPASNDTNQTQKNTPPSHLSEEKQRKYNSSIKGSRIKSEQEVNSSASSMRRESVVSVESSPPSEDFLQLLNESKNPKSLRKVQVHSYKDLRDLRNDNAEKLNGNSPQGVTRERRDSAIEFIESIESI